MGWFRKKKRTLGSLVVVSEWEGGVLVSGPPLAGDEPTRRRVLAEETPDEAAAAATSGDSVMAAFAAARDHLKAGHTADAARLYATIGRSENVEAPIRLLAWRLGRRAGLEPDSNLADRVMGIAVDIAHPDGRDLMATGRDASARYYRSNGDAILISVLPEPLLDGCNELFSIATRVRADFTIVTDATSSAPPPGHARLFVLTPRATWAAEVNLDGGTRHDSAADLWESVQELFGALHAFVWTVTEGAEES
jgi:hypothetical protein